MSSQCEPPKLTIDICAAEAVPDNTHQSESIKEEKKGAFSTQLAGRKRTATEAFGDHSLWRKY